MPIDFTLNDNQRRLRREARQFAKDVLSGVPVATRDLPRPIERFVATRPFYERLVAEGFLRKCIPVSVGGDCAGLVYLAIFAEGFYTLDAYVCRTDARVEPSRGISIIAVPRPDSGLIFEHAFDTLGHRAHLMPRFRLEAVQVPAGNLLGQEGGGLQLAAQSFAGSAALVGIFGVALMRAAFQFALSFAKSERRGGIQEVIQHQAVGYALADAKTTIEAARVLSWHACRAFDAAAPGALELAIHAKVFGSEAAVRVITDLLRVCGFDSYGHELPLAGLLQDAVALPLFAGGNIRVRRRQLHALMLDPAYDDLATLDGICLAETVP